MTILSNFQNLLPSRTDYKDLPKSWRADIIAGITVGIVALPLALAFAITTGASASAGLTTAIIAGLIAAIFGGSHLQVSGPTGAMTVVLVPIVSKFGVSVLIPLGITAGITLLVFGLFKAGSLINRVPWPVMEGFTLGIAMVIGLQQMPMALGVDKASGSQTVQVAFHTFQSALHAGLNRSSLLVVLATLIIKFATPRVLHFFKIKLFIPGSFLSILVMTLVVWIAGINVATVGALPKNIFHYEGAALGLHGLSISTFATAALSIAFLAAIESLLSARVADQMAHHQELTKVIPNRELIGQGFATLFSALLGGLPATGAIARTSVNVRSGAKTRFASVVHALFLVLVVLVLSPFISHVPTATLAAVLIGTSYRIANPVQLREFLTTTKRDAAVLFITAFAVLGIDLIWGIICGIFAYFISGKFPKALNR